MQVSVGICTWNRAAYLRKTLEAMRKLRVPAGVSWELIVVDNNSTDETPHVVDSFAKILPIRRLFEPEQGKARACNLVVREARGELLLWTDDDVLVDPDWMANYVDAARRFPEVSYFGGTIDPIFESAPPSWMTRNVSLLCGPFAVLQLGEITRPFSHDEFPFGANMAVRTDAHRAHPFNVRLGPTGNLLLRGEETYFIEALKGQGHKGLWVGSAKVRHFVPRRRLTIRYLWQWYRTGGISAFRAEGLPTDCAFIGGTPRYIFRGLWQGRILTLLLWPFKGRRWIRAFRQAATSEGFLYEFHNARRLRPSGRMYAGESVG